MRPALLAFAILALGCAGSAEPGPSPHRASLHASSAWDELPAASRDAIAQAPLPFLLFPEEYAPGTTAMAGEHFAALSYRDDALSISLHGTDVSHPVVSQDELDAVPPPAHSVRGEPARLLVNEGIRSVAWSEAGVAWSLEIECVENLSDVRCTEDAFVLELAERLERAPQGGAR